MVDIKSTSNAAWWIKNPKELERRKQPLGTKMCQDMTDLFRNISLHGYDKLLDAELYLYEKFIWLCFQVATIVVVITILSYTWDQFVLQSFVVNLHDPLYRIENMPFPAVSICSNNRISRQAAEKYANELSLKDPRKRPQDYFLQRIKYFISLYFKYERSDNFEEFKYFQTFLDNFGTADNETYYDILKAMRMLTPNCKDLIVRCFLAGEPINCFDKNAFEDGLTMYGPCCTFNSQDAYRKRNYTNRLLGSDLGLTVILNTSHADDMVSLLNIDGYVVIIHNPNEFPDISSGSALEVFPMVNDESFIAIKAKFMDTGEELRTFAPTYRNCYFDDETPAPSLLLHNTYTFTNCITRCRIRSIIALCRCIPFYMPLELMGTVDVPYCTLSHIECMQLYSFKWRNVLTERIFVMGLERELEEALYCSECLPSCDDTQYDISMTSLPTDNFRRQENMGEDVHKILKDLSILRVGFHEPTVLYYKRVISNTWVEALSTVGNIVSIFVGFSMVALFEILFFITKYLYIAIQRYIRSDMNTTQQNKKKKGKEAKPITKLYILP